jgi:hypothetical protein
MNENPIEMKDIDDMYDIDRQTDRQTDRQIEREREREVMNIKDRQRKDERETRQGAARKER